MLNGSSCSKSLSLLTYKADGSTSSTSKMQVSGRHVLAFCEASKMVLSGGPAGGRGLTTNSVTE